MYRSATTYSEKPNRQSFRVWNSHGQRGHMTMVIPGAAFSAVRLAAVPYVVHSTIGLLSDSYASCQSLVTTQARWPCEHII